MNVFTLTGKFLMEGTDKAQRDIKNTSNIASNASNTMNEAFKKVGKTIATVFTVKKVVDFGKAVVKSSAEISAEISAFQQIMGDGADYATTRMNDLAKRTGVVVTRLTPYMTSMTAKFKGLGQGITEATNNAVTGLELATDASAFWDISLEDSMSALNSFLNGSYEGGMRIGLFANETEIATYAMREGIVKTTSEFSKLSNEQKQMLRLDFAKQMMKQSGVIGQASKESQEFANQTANLAEKWRQFKAQIGEPILRNVVLPAIQALNKGIDGLSKKVEEAKSWLSDHRDLVLKVKDAFELAGIAVGGFVAVLSTVKIVSTVASGLSSLFNPIGLLIMGIGLFAVALIKAWQTSEEFRDKLSSVWESVKSGFNNLWESAQNLWNNLLAPLIDGVWVAIQDFFAKISPAWATITGALASLWESLTEIFAGVTGNADSMGSIVQTVCNVIGTALDGVAWVINNVLAPIIEGMAQFVSDHIEPIKAYIQGIIDFITGIINAFIAVLKGDWDEAYAWLESAFNGLVTAIKNWFSVLLDGIKAIIHWDSVVKPWLENLWSNFTNWLSTAWGNITTFFTDIIEGMKDIGKNIIQGIIDGVTGWWNNLKEGIVNTGKNIVNWFKDVLGIHSPSTVFEELGQFIMQGLGIGLEESENEATSPLNSLLDKLMEILSNNTVFQDIAKSLGLDISKWMKEGIDEGLENVEVTPEVTPPPETEIPKTMNWFQKLGARIKKWWNGIKVMSEDANGNMTLDFKATVENIGDLLQKAINIYEMTIGSFIDNIRELMMVDEENYVNHLQKELDDLKESHDERLDAYKAETKVRKAEYAKQYADGTLTYSQYIAKVKELDSGLSAYEQQLKDAEQAKEEELNRKKDEIARKQFEANKENQITKALTNAAMAIIQCYAELGPIAGSIATAAVATATGIEIATINKQEYVSAYAKGGIIDKPTIGLIGEDGREAVVPLERNLEWTESLAKAIEPSISQTSEASVDEVRGLRVEMSNIRDMLADFLQRIVDRPQVIGVSSGEMVYALASDMDTQLGKIRKMNSRR